jgi:acyl carrier protein
LKPEVDDWLTEWFVARGKIGKTVPDSLRNSLRDTDYFEAGWLTSMEAVEFVTDIEQRFGLQFSDADLQDVRFVTIAGLTDLILQRSTQASESR